MSLLWKLSNADRLLIKNGFLSINAYYSRRSKSKEFDSFYKVVSEKPRFKDRLYFDEPGPNWEIFDPKGSRFYLPTSLGPAWQSTHSTVTVDMKLENLIDFECKESNKLHISSNQCPLLIRSSLHELFPTSEVLKKGALTVITLSYDKDTEIENGAKNFVIAAREMCGCLHNNGFWADFMNPFSGKPFFLQSSGRKLYKIDERFRGLGVKFEMQNNCLVISSHVDGAFSASIFTNGPKECDVLKKIFLDKKTQDIEKLFPRIEDDNEDGD